LDVGGSETFWGGTEVVRDAGINVVLLNQLHLHPQLPRFTAVTADARDMRSFGDGEFDVVFSNSVIEHLGDWESQRLMAKEVIRVGKRYFVQTPNRLFPLEPHFLFPFFQFLPLSWRISLVQHFDLGWYAKGRIPDRSRARETVTAIRLLSLSEMRSLFPSASIQRERLAGLTKALVAYGGWSVKRLPQEGQR